MEHLAAQLVQTSPPRTLVEIRCGSPKMAKRGVAERLAAVRGCRANVRFIDNHCRRSLPKGVYAAAHSRMTGLPRAKKSSSDSDQSRRAAMSASRCPTQRISCDSEMEKNRRQI